MMGKQQKSVFVGNLDQEEPYFTKAMSQKSIQFEVTKLNLIEILNKTVIIHFLLIAAMEKAVEKYCNLDIVVNNAGIIAEDNINKTVKTHYVSC